MRIFVRPAMAVVLASALAMPAFGAGDAPPAAHPPFLTLAELKARYGDPAYRFADLGGVEVAYKDEGSGPAILMVHGSVSTLKTWDYVAARLAAHHRVIRYDIPPGGLSGSISDAVAATVRPADVAERLLGRLGLTAVTFVGVSSGGTLGVFLAADRPDLVNRLILSNTPADLVDPSHMTPSPALAAAMREAKRTHFQSRGFWDAFLSFFSGDPARVTEDIRRQYYDFNRRTPEHHPLVLVAQVADHAKAIVAMAKVTAPTLLVWGGADPLLTPKSADALAGYLTHAQVSKVIMPDVGHYPPLEAPVRFAAIVQTYIDDITPEVGAEGAKR